MTRNHQPKDAASRHPANRSGRARRWLAGMVAVFALMPLAIMGAAPVNAETEEETEFDVVVYGGTSGGVVAAVQAARMGKSAIIVNHYRHIGGLTSSGLGRTDTGRIATIGGVSREFYQRVRDYYRDEDVWRQETRQEYMDRTGGDLEPGQDAQWGFEPHAAEAIYDEMIEEAGVEVAQDEFLVRDGGGGVVKDGARIEAIVTESGRTFRGKMFIDATYEGDLLAEAGVSYIVGREGNEQYGETLNGIQTQNTVNHVFTHEAERPHPPRPLPEEARVSPYVIEDDPESGLLPGINPDAGGEDGEGDHRVQAYCYRLCLTDDPDNQVPLDPPEGYDEADFELLFRMFEAGEERIPWLPGDMPNRKNDTNNRWAVSMNLIGGSDDYPEASYEERRAIEKEHEYWQRGIMHSLAHHPRVPEHVREEVSQWGYAADEFTDNDHWPYQIYVRVGRRMISDYVMTELDCRLERIPEDPVGMGSYTMDSHNVQRYVTEQDYVQNEGNIEVRPAGAYRISYRSIVPKREEAENLLVPVAVSSSHIAFGSIRMEPVFMILGQSAATAAAMAIDDEVNVQDVNYERLRERLLEDGQVLTTEHDASMIRPADLPGIVVDHRRAETTGRWSTSSVVSGYVGSSYLQDLGEGQGEKSVRYEAELPEAGRYEVRISYTAHGNRATNAPVTIYHADGSEQVLINQREDPPIDGSFISLGEFEFGETAAVVIANDDADGHVIADAVQWIALE